MKKLLYFLVLIFVENTIVLAAANTTPFDTIRIYNAMAKARRGEPLTIGVIGGSITQGYAASSENKRWTNLMTQWWRDSFPKSKITLINAGIGGTGSDIATHRVQKDLLQYNPDFVVIEFSVNDSKGEYASKMMEGLVRQILAAPNHPGIMILLLKMENGTTAQESHKIIGEYYEIPMVSFADIIDAKVASDGKTLHEIFIDGLHPVDLGMSYIAEFLKDELSILYKNLPADEKLSQIDTAIPKSLYGNIFEKTYKYDNTSIVPYSNQGWSEFENGWTTNTPGSEVIFRLDGNAISIEYSQYFTTNRGQAEVWVDNGTHIILDGYFNENWGPARRFSLIGENLQDGEHFLHVKSLSTTSSGSTGHYFQILNVSKAGNINGSVPIVKTNPYVKTFKNVPVVLDASLSYSPDSLKVDSFAWDITSMPFGSLTIINNPYLDKISINPDKSGIYKLNLTVCSNETCSNVYKVTIQVKESNIQPKADAGNDTIALIKKSIILNGKGSSDDDGDSISYTWRVISQPLNSKIVFDNPAISNPSFKPIIKGSYVLGLTVNDGFEESKEDTVTVQIVISLGVSKKLKSNIFIDAYPNPANKTLRYIANSQPGKNLFISFCSTSGTCLYNYHYIIDNKLIMNNINIENLPSGSYYLMAYDENGNYNTKRVIISR